jgi:hypothetical protein
MRDNPYTESPLTRAMIGLAFVEGDDCVSRRSTLLVGAALGLGVVAILVVVSQRGGAPSRTQFAGSEFTLHHETPFSHAEQVDLPTAIADAPFRIIRPHHPAASDESITEVWLQRASPPDGGYGAGRPVVRVRT